MTLQALSFWAGSKGQTAQSREDGRELLTPFSWLLLQRAHLQTCRFYLQDPSPLFYPLCHSFNSEARHLSPGLSQHNSLTHSVKYLLSLCYVPGNSEPYLSLSLCTLSQFCL